MGPDQRHPTKMEAAGGVFFFLIQSMLCELTHDGPILFYFIFLSNKRNAKYSRHRHNPGYY